MKFNPIVNAILRQMWAISPELVSTNAFILSSLINGKLDFAQDTPSPVKAFVDFNEFDINASTGDSMVDFSKTKAGTILMLPIHGTMFKNGGLCSWGMTDIEATLLEASQNANIIGAVLDLDSGGGEVGSVAPVINGIAKMKANGKPVVALADIAGSAAYWIASACDNIIASNDISATFGSVGVMAQWIDAMPVLKKLGYELHTVYADQSTEKNKAFQLALEGEYDKIRTEMLNPLAIKFIKTVQKNRNLSIDKEHTFYKGSVHYAQEALSLGIIDKIGTLEDAIKFVNKNAKKTSSTKANSNLNYNTMKFTKILPFIGLTALESSEGNVSLSKEQIETLTSNFKSKLNIDVSFKDVEYDAENNATFSLDDLAKLESQIPEDFKFENEKATPEATEENQAKTDTDAVVETLKQNINALQEQFRMQKETFDLQMKEIEKATSKTGVIKPINIQSQKPNIPMLKKEIKQRELTIVGGFLFGDSSNYMKVDASRPWNIAAQNKLEGKPVTPSLAITDVDISQINNDFGELLTGRKGEIIKWFAPDDTFANVFPAVPNAKESDMFFSLNLDEVTQAYQKAWTPKGNVKLQARKPRLFDIKIDLTFEDLKAIERTWLADFNREGSNAYKMAFVEYLIFVIASKAVLEDQVAMIRGRYLAPTTGVAGNYLHKMDGLREIFFQLVENREAKAFAHIGEWAEGNTMQFVDQMVKSVPEEFRSRPGLGFYVPDLFINQYWKDRRTVEGQINDYDSSKDHIPGFENIKIIKVPHAGNSKRCFITPIGNVTQLIGFNDNDAPRFEVEKSKRQIDVLSDYKKSMHIIVAGWKSETDQEFAERGYEKQLIWFNNVDLPSNEPLDVNPNQAVLSAKRHNVLRTVENTDDTAITNITDATIGTPITIVCGSIIKASTIANAGKFALSGGNWEPTEVGETITLLPRSDGKFVEMERSTPSDEPDAIEFTANDATPSVEDGNFFKTSATNSGPLTITNLDDAVADEVYKIYGNDGTHATTIANGGNFVLAATWTGATGNYLVLRYNGVKFFEITRQS